MDLKVNLKKMEVWEEEIVEVVDMGLSVVVEEMIVVEDKVVHKVVEVDTKVVASVSNAMVMY